MSGPVNARVYNREYARMNADQNASLPPKPRLVVVGGGFGGLWATRALAGSDLDIVLVDKQNHHLFQPLLYQVATAGLSSGDIAAPLRHILRKQANVEVRLGEVVAINAQQKQVQLKDGQQISFDYLLLASGASHAYFGNDHWEKCAPGLKTLDDALTIRRRLLLAFERAESAASAEEREACLHFAVVGGGPTGVELAGTLAEIARHTLKNEFRHIDPASAKVRLIEAGPRILAAFPESLSRSATLQLEKLGVEVQCGTAVKDIGADYYLLGDTRVATRTVLWAAGVAASALGKQLSVPLDRAGRVIVEADLSVPGHSNIFVVGDLASFTQNGKPVPGVAPAAKQMGAFVAKVIQRRLTLVQSALYQSAATQSTGTQSIPTPSTQRKDGAKELTQSFRYQDFGNLATIGRLAAVVDLRGFKFSGMLAWAFWLAAHVFFLIGFRNRILVMINWTWAYFSYERHARVIYDVAASPNIETPPRTPQDPLP
jgi:NADH:ubiquinone reductase (H+-translocating)